MVRPYGIKVNKRKERPARYDKEEDEEEEQPNFEQKPKGGKSSKKAKKESTSITKEDNEMSEEAAASEDIVGGIPIVLTDRSTKKPGVVFVLEKASLEVAKVGKTYQLLNCDDHAHFLRRNNRNPADYRPDITHQALLMILDSPVNKAGRLKAVYVKTEKGVLFEVKPHARIPRTFKRFAGIMLQLLQKLSITAFDKREKLVRRIQNPVKKHRPVNSLKIVQLLQKMSITAFDNQVKLKLLRCIKNPVKDHLPVNSRKIGFSHSSEKLVNMPKYLSTVCNDTDTVFVLGAMAHGKIECDYIDDFVSISGYPLSAAYCISRICEALSTNWNII